MKNILFVIALLLGIFEQNYASDKRIIDSLLNHLKTVKEDSNKVLDLLQLSIAHQNNNLETAINYAKQSLLLSEEIGYKKGIGSAYHVMGTIFYYKGDYSKALDLLRKSIKIRKEIGDERGIAGSYNNLGMVYERQGNYSDAVKLYFEALNINIKIGNKKWQQKNYNGIGSVFANQGKYPEALKYFFMSLKISEDLGDKEGIGTQYSNIGSIKDFMGNHSEALKYLLASLKIAEETGNKRSIANCYFNLSVINGHLKNSREELNYVVAALEIQKEIGNKEGIAESYNSLGMIYSSQNNTTEALKSYLASLKISEEMGKKTGTINPLLNIAYQHIKQKNYNDALKYLKRSLTVSKEIGNLKGIQDSYIRLAHVDSALGNFKQALIDFRLAARAHDSLINEENIKKSLQLEMKHEFDKKESLAKAEQDKKDAIAKRELQRQKLVRNGFIGGFATVLLFAFVFFSQRNKITREKKISEAERKKAEIEKERSEELLLNILPSEVAAELKETGHCRAKTFSMVTVMFTDFKDFTSVSEKVSAELLVDEINYCFSAFDHIVQKYKVEKIKTVGDAYICVSGLPVLNFTHAVDMVIAAIEIRNFINNRKFEKEAKGEIPFELRIGIHTGPVVAGIVGVKKFQYDIWGDTVNIASRMESSGEAGYVNISGATYELVKDKFNCTYRGKVQAKHKGEFDMYFVENLQ
jgi:adenylate cyclase